MPKIISAITPNTKRNSNSVFTELMKNLKRTIPMIKRIKSVIKISAGETALFSEVIKK